MENLGPYTNFHELNQDWFLQEFNKLVAQWKAMQKNFDNLQDAFNDLKSYVQDYFKNLDVQEEINNKLNNMAKSGELSNLIMPFITENANPIFVVSESDMTDKTKTYVLTTNGHIFTYIKNSFVDSGLVYGITNLSMLGFGSLFYSNESLPEVYKDFNNLPNNKILWYSGINGLVNAPKENFSGCVITYSYVADGGAKVQVCYEQQKNNIFTRVFNSDKWSTWNSPLNAYGSLFYSNEVLPDEYKDFNNLPNNKILWYSGINGLVNAPKENFSGCVITYSYVADGGAKVQVCYEQQKNNIFTRVFNSDKWSTWNSPLNAYGSLFYSNEVLPDEYKDFNNLPNNKILWYSGINGLVNAPKENFSGCVITYSYVAEGGAKVQVCYEQQTNNIFTRVFSSDKWSTWVSTLTEKETNFYVNFPDKTNNFNSVTDCLYAVQKTKGIKNVYINSGTYDILNELGGMTYINNIDTSKDWDEVQPVVNDCNIYGIGDVLLKMELETTTHDKYFLFSPLNVRGNIHIENINVKAKKCRYCIHDESGTNYPNTIKEYINVNCFHDNSEYGGQAVGCGYSKNTKAYFKNCNFKCSGTSEAFSVHEAGDCTLTFNSTYFYSLSTTGCVRISEVGFNYCNVKFINCILKDSLYLRDEIQPSTSNGNTKVDLINSYYLKVKSDYPTNLSEITQYNTLTGEVKTIETV
jgi:hypothetical protein